MQAMIRVTIRAALTAAACLIGFAASAAEPVAAPKALNVGDVLNGQLNNLRGHDAKGKRNAVFQLTSEPRRLPAPAGLCNLENGPETFEIVTTSEAQAGQLRKLVGKQVTLKVAELSCADKAGQMSEAQVTKWSVVGK
jgi:hypothetical protein